ncbi:MAG: glycosyltransferase family 4 protein [Nodosilinea sp. LVE1205-7]|jgi:glycosyltransferase involved in cell wall biosynthesis
MYKLLLVTEQSFYPEVSGGSEISTAYLLSELHRRNWQVEVICSSSLKNSSWSKSWWTKIKSLRLFPPAFRDLEQGYTVWRILSKFTHGKKLIRLLEKKLINYRPQVVLGLVDINCSLLNHALNRGYHCFYIARVAEIIEGAEYLPPGLNIIPNSPFIASSLKSLTDQNHGFVLPFVEPTKCKVQHHQKKYVTFINPVPQKGVETVVKVAQNMPDVQFLFVKGNWFTYKSNEEYFIKEARLLPNVEVWEHQEDVRSIYEVTDILLVPSIFKETFGRVILEAHINGIPVIASNVGGIDYTLGLGGVLIDSSRDFEAYVEAIRTLKSDSKFYSNLSRLAFENSQRPEFDPEFQINNFIAIINDYLKKYQ